jgi:hypothetical protein
MRGRSMPDISYEAKINSKNLSMFFDDEEAKKEE